MFTLSVVSGQRGRGGKVVDEDDLQRVERRHVAQ